MTQIGEYRPTISSRKERGPTPYEQELERIIRAETDIEIMQRAHRAGYRLCGYKPENWKLPADQYSEDGIELLREIVSDIGGHPSKDPPYINDPMKAEMRHWNWHKAQVKLPMSEMVEIEMWEQDMIVEHEPGVITYEWNVACEECMLDNLARRLPISASVALC